MFDTATRAGVAWRPWGHAPAEREHLEERRTMGGPAMVCHDVPWRTMEEQRSMAHDPVWVPEGPRRGTDDEARFDEFDGREVGGRCESGGWIANSTGAAQCNSADPAAQADSISANPVARADDVGAVSAEQAEASVGVLRI